MAKKLADFYTVKAAAKAIGIKYLTLHQRIHRGTVKVERLGERHILVPRSEVERLKNEKGQPSC